MGYSITSETMKSILTKAVSILELFIAKVDLTTWYTVYAKTIDLSEIDYLIISFYIEATAPSRAYVEFFHNGTSLYSTDVGTSGYDYQKITLSAGTTKERGQFVVKMKTSGAGDSAYVRDLAVYSSEA